MNLFALTFTSVSMLGGLGLASLPIIIHLLNRRRFKQMDWAAMDFLLKAAVRNRKRVRVENLLLLLLRTLIVVLLILAVARPFTESQSALAGMFGSSGGTERIILLDDSHSMRAGQGNRSAFAVAKNMVVRMITRLNSEHSDDRITLVLASDPRGRSTGRNTAGGSSGGGISAGGRGIKASGANALALVERVKKLRPSDGVFDVAATIDAILQSQEEQGSRIALDIISDLRRRDWTDADGKVLPPVSEAINRFTERGEIRLVDVGNPPVQNLGVVQLQSRDRAVVAGVPTTFVARIKNHGPEPVDGSKIQISFQFGETRLDPVWLEGTLHPGETAEVTQEFTFRSRGPVVVQAKIPTEVLSGDDTRRLVVHVRKAMRFLLVDGEPDPEAYRGESDFLAAALMPPGNVVSGIEVEIVPEQQFHERLLKNVDGLFLLNVYRLPLDRVKAIEDYVRGGGGLVFFLGDQVDPSVYNTTFYGKGELAGKGLLPLYLLEEEGRSDDYSNLAAPSLDHPAIRFMAGLNQIAFNDVHVRRFMGTRLQARDDTRVLLNWTDENSSPALAEKAYGKGRVMLWTTSADMEWADLPRSLLYVPLMHELARYIVKPDPSETTLRVGSAISLRFDPSQMQRMAHITAPAAEAGGSGMTGSPMPLSMTEIEGAKGEFEFRYPRTPIAGVYTIRTKTPHGDERVIPFALNVEPGEGDLRLADRAALMRMDRVSLHRATEESVLDTDESDRTEFWRTLIFLLITFAALETLLAWRFGHHSRAKQSREEKQVFVR